MNCRQWIVELNKTCSFMSVEQGCKRATNSELSRWIEQGSLLINGERVSLKEEMDFPIISVVLHPKSKNRRITLI